MPIQVTCPSCFKRFQVSDKFAGKTGPCPSCKKQIKVPDKDEEVVVHAPDDDAPKDKAGKSVLKPVERTETDVTRKGMLITGGAILAAVAFSVGFRMTGGLPAWAAVVGAILLAPPLVWAGYSFVRESELAPYTGEELRNRVLIVSGIFSALWLLYAFVPSYITETDSAAEMSFLAFGIIFLIMLVICALASAGAFELEFLNGLAHAGLYLIATMVLALISGITLAGGSPDITP
jgi:cation transport ATPase